MYQKIKEDLQQEYYVNTYPNEGQRFIAWYLRNIHNLDIVEARDCITDGANDKQIDAVYIDDQTSTIYIIQGKFYGGTTIDAEPLREVLSSWVNIQNLQELQESANSRLQVKIAEIAAALEEDYDVCFELITTASLTPSAERDLKRFRKELADNDQLSANLVLVDNDTLKFRYSEAINQSRPYINHDFVVDRQKMLEMTLSGIKIVVAAIPLKECVKIPGIKDGSLFRKNVRQSLGKNKVNKEITDTLKNKSSDFFFYHNGITAICSKISVSENTLSVKDLNVVNGCQSLSTIYSFSETAKNADDGYIMFRFYEISDAEKSDKISNSTNSQTAVKARDLRSNHKAVLLMKKSYEQRYNNGCFITKRGEKAETGCNPAYVVDIADLGKQLLAWHSQRPNNTNNESKIFDKYFDQLFRKDYAPEKIQALKELSDAVFSKWNAENPMEINDSLLAMKKYAPYHHLYTISVLFCQINSMPDMVPNPQKALECLKKASILEEIVDVAGQCLSAAFEKASADAIENDEIFSPQNWTKTKVSMKNINEMVKTRLSGLKFMPDTKEMIAKLESAMKMSRNDFEARWSAD